MGLPTSFTIRATTPRCKYLQRTLDMKILMTADAMGGVWTYALELIRALQNQYDAQVLLATLGDLPSEAQRAQCVDEHSELRSLNCKLEWMDEPWGDVEESGRWLQNLAREFAPDIVHLNGYAHAALSWPAPVVCVAHSCVLSWWRAVKNSDAPSSWNCYRQKVRAGLHAADAVVAPTQAMLHEIETFYGPLPQASEFKIAIHNGLRAAETRGKYLQGDFSQTQRDPFVFAAGRLWDEAKNIAALDRIAASLPWPIRVAGDDRHPDGTRRATRVQNLGFITREALEEQLNAATIYALPARYEPFGLSILEAALHGCALVLGDIPTLREVWGESAIFVAPDDDVALLDALCALIENPMRCEQLARKSFARAQRYRAATMAAQYDALYRKLTY